VEKTGYLDYGTWCVATINKRDVLNEANLQTAFKMFDKEDLGYINALEIANVLGYGKTVEPEVWHDIIREVDTDEDGKINFSEFRNMMCKLADK
jgi:calcium-dependent protein kinase